MEPAPAVAYFSMEVALDERIPTYSGGLGVLAGDHLRAAADLGIRAVGVTLLYRDGYFRQEVDSRGRQLESPVTWSPEALLEKIDVEARVSLDGRDVLIRAWRFVIEAQNGHRVPVLLLDTDVDDNQDEDRAITDQLYGGDARHRLRQEAVLGLGGMAVLAGLGWGDVPTLHMNEGHSALLTLAALFDHAATDGDQSAGAKSAVRGRCVFTTHTPVPAGHDRFPRAMVKEVLGERIETELATAGCLANDELNMTRLGIAFSGFVNAVSARHAEVTREMFPDVRVHYVTNGVHAATWTARPMADLFDRHLDGWRRTNAKLRSASILPLDELGQARRACKAHLMQAIAERTGVRLDPEALTIAVARRAAAYKRLDFLLRDPERLRVITKRAGPLQILYSGKAHPQDEDGKAALLRIFEQKSALEGAVETVFIENYSLELAKALCAGSDLWLNTPEPPLEASGTSGMKAALNGVPSLSVLDGWWIEGHVEGVTGWSVEDPDGAGARDGGLDHLLDQLESKIVPLFYEYPRTYLEVGRSCIALNGSYFNTERMVREYAATAYQRSAVGT